MILAAAEAAEGGRPPPELELAWQCRRWGMLPEGGGLLDQPAGLIRRMGAVEDVYAAWREWKTVGTDAEAMMRYMRENARGYELVRAVMELRMERG